MKFSKEELNKVLVEVKSEDAIEDLTIMDYSKYLKTKYWKEVKSTIHDIVGSKCEICGNDSNINVHHLNYDNRGAETLNNLVCICGKCHAAIHKNRKGMFIKEMNNREQFEIQSEIVTKIKETFTNEDYLRILPLTQRGMWEIGQLQSLFNYNEKQVKDMFVNEVESGLISVLISVNEEKEYEFYALDNLLWSLIVVDFPKISTLEGTEQYMKLEFVEQRIK